jgi:hypothetical protein
MMGVERAQRGSGSNGLLNHLSEDHLSFDEIARGWSKASREEPVLLKGELVAAFWQGKFEGDMESVLFTLEQPESDGFRKSGNFAARSLDVIVEVDDEQRSNITAKRTVSPIFREAVPYVHCRPQWRGIKLTDAERDRVRPSWQNDSNGPFDLEELDERERDLICPEWRDEFNAQFGALSTIPFQQWPAEMQRLHYARWRIKRHHFAAWYKTSPLSAGVALITFWPSRARERSTLVEALPSTIGVETACRMWLEERIRESLTERTATFEDLLAEARQKWPNLSRRGFRRARDQAVQKTGAEAWRRGGAPKKT